MVFWYSDAFSKANSKAVVGWCSDIAKICKQLEDELASTQHNQ